jgi:hypothetical protein
MPGKLGEASGTEQAWIGPKGVENNGSILGVYSGDDWEEIETLGSDKGYWLSSSRVLPSAGQHTAVISLNPARTIMQVLFNLHFTEEEA